MTTTNSYVVKGKSGVDALLAFMLERHRIYIRRFVEKVPPPWTDDPILQRFRFCNIFRELDTVTIWIREHIREPYAKHPNLWFMLCAARQINWPPTLQELMDNGAWPTERWNPKKARDVMQKIKNQGRKLYTSAYMLNAHGRGPSDPADKAFFTCYLVLAKLWNEREKVALPALKENSMQSFSEMLLQYHGWGGFTAYEATCDLRWTRYLKKAPDINTWANIGPGAVRGINRVLQCKVDAPLKQATALAETVALHKELKAKWPKNFPALELREIEHSCCEYDKYERARLGEGRPKEHFISGKTTTV